MSDLWNIQDQRWHSSHRLDQRTPTPASETTWPRAGTVGSQSTPLRLAFYSHDAMGVGHVRRNVLIAQEIIRSTAGATALMICGVHEATAFTGGNGIDCLTIPTMKKHGNDDYRPRDLRIDGASVSAVRRATLESALLAYRPDILVVDKVPKGLQGELSEILPRLRAQGTRTVFGMREILDQADQVRAEWAVNGYPAFIRDHYDEVWIYGDPQVFDPISEYGFAEHLPHAIQTGYLDQRVRLQHLDESVAGFHRPNLEQTVLCMVGGGQDGLPLAQAFAQAQFPDHLQGLIVTGPLMRETDRQAVMALANRNPRIEVVSHVAEADLLTDRVVRVVCMGGYNSLVSVVSFEKPSLIVPRVSPRQEQLIRATRFAERGWVEMLMPDRLSPSAIERWLQTEDVPRPCRKQLDLQGLQRIQQSVQAMDPRTDRDAAKATLPSTQPVDRRYS